MLDLFAVFAPVLLCIALGALWSKLAKPFDPAAVSQLVAHIGAPALLFNTLVTTQLPEQSLVAQTGAAFALMGLNAAAAALILKLRGAFSTSFMAALMFPNWGNLGIPLALATFGDAGLAVALPMFAVAALCQTGIAPWLVTGRISLPGLLKMPIVLSILAVILVRSADLAVPDWLLRVTDILGGMVVPLMLFALGVSIMRLSRHLLASTFPIVILRVVAGLAIGMLVVPLFGLSDVGEGVAILFAAMPLAVFNYLWAAHYDRQPERAAAMVVQSTALAALVLPPLVAYLQWQAV